MKKKKLQLTEKANEELLVICGAVEEIINLTLHTYQTDDLTSALQVEALEQVVDDLKDALRSNHILRLQRGECAYDMGFVWSDILTNLERVALWMRHRPALIFMNRCISCVTTIPSTGHSWQLTVKNTLCKQKRPSPVRMVFLFGQ